MFNGNQSSNPDNCQGLCQFTRGYDGFFQRLNLRDVAGYAMGEFPGSEVCSAVACGEAIYAIAGRWLKEWTKHQWWSGGDTHGKNNIEK